MDTLVLPRGRVAWGAYALITVIFTISSAAPFVRLGTGVPRLSGPDLVATTVYLASWIPFLALAMMLVRRMPRPQAWIVHVALLLSIPAAHTVVFRATVDGLAGVAPDVPAILSSPAFQVLTLLGTLQYLVLLAVGIAVAAGRAADRDRALATSLEVERSRLSERLATARLDALTSQLRPHFLFNTLNSISVLTTSDPPAAQAMIGQLSGLLRTILAADERPTVPLTAELQVVNAYLDIQHVRFGDRLHVRFDIEPQVVGCAVPALLLQPLVENAIEHGVANREAGGVIRISAKRMGGRVVITVSDNGADERSTFAPHQADLHAGIGLTNIRERLQHLYGDGHRFDVQYLPLGCTVTIELPATLASDGGR